jgi:hypothetical protein
LTSTGALPAVKSHSCSVCDMHSRTADMSSKMQCKDLTVVLSAQSRQLPRRWVDNVWNQLPSDLFIACFLLCCRGVRCPRCPEPGAPSH